jgi:uncharacterized protein
MFFPDTEMNEDLVIDKTRNYVKEVLSKDSSGHDYWHAHRVSNLAKKIGEKERANLYIVELSALLHDTHRIIQRQTGKFCSPKDSLPKVKEILEEQKIDNHDIQKILHCIEFHEEYDFSKNGKSVKDIETLVLQDADNLDAIGAIGIGRTFAYGGTHSMPMYLPGADFNRDTYDESENDVSTIHHFYSKLLRLKDNMNTETGKEMAKRRHTFMVIYLEEFSKEWDGKC